MATIVMSAEKVIEAAESVIADIYAARKAEDELMIKHKIAQSEPNKFFTYLGFKPLTRNQAIDKLASDIWGWFPSQKAWGDLKHAKKLLILAKHGDPVTLNEEDTRVLF